MKIHPLKPMKRWNTQYGLLTANVRFALKTGGRARLGASSSIAAIEEFKELAVTTIQQTLAPELKLGII